jgi:hypothetical protein
MDRRLHTRSEAGITLACDVRRIGETSQMRLRRFVLGLATVAALASIPAPAQAAPVLQLDIMGGTYDSNTRTVVASDAAFTLVALLTPDAAMLSDLNRWLSETYYISAALTPQVHQPGDDLGSFTFSGSSLTGQQPTPLTAGTTQATSDMAYGTPPVEAIENFVQSFDAGDLEPHSIYPTYFTEFAFRFSPVSEIATYDSRYDRQTALPAGTGTYYATFTVDTSDLARTHQLHFDTYATRLRTCAISGTCLDEDIKLAGAFDRDAQSAPIPEPASLLLLSFGLFGTSAAARRARRANKPVE